MRKDLCQPDQLPSGLPPQIRPRASLWWQNARPWFSSSRDWGHIWLGL